MIRPLRTIHRRMFYILAIALPALVAIALIARHPTPDIPAVAPASAPSSRGPVGGTP